MGTRRGHQLESRRTPRDGRRESDTTFGDAMLVLSTLRHDIGRSDAFERHLHDETESEKLWQSVARRVTN